MRDRHSGASVSNLNYDPRYLQNVAQPLIRDMPQRVSDEERQMARFETENNNTPEHDLDRARAREAARKLEIRRKKLRYLKEKGYA
jgi:hypothetical protein